MRYRFPLHRLVLILIIILSLLLLLMIVIYPIHFYTLKISSSTADWADFAVYYTFIVSFGNTIAVIILSYAVYRSQLDRDKWERIHLEIQETPSLIFVFDGLGYYRLYNMGKGTAHKIVVGKVPHGLEEIEKSPFKAYSIPPSAYIPAEWTKSSTVLYAYYENEKKEKFLTKCEGDINEEISTKKGSVGIMEYLNQNANRRDDIKLVFP
jgi:hypothetical protein